MRRFLMAVGLLLLLGPAVSFAADPVPAQVKGAEVVLPVEEFGRLVGDARLSLPWKEFQKFLVTEAGMGRFKIPWEFFLKFLDTGDVKPAPKPPADYLLSGLYYTGRPEKNVINLKLSGELTVLKEADQGWTIVKLWPTNSAFLTLLTLNGQAARVMVADNTYQLLVNAPGTYKIEGELQLRLAGDNLRFTPPPNTASVMRLALPGDYDVSSSGVVKIVTRSAEVTAVEVTFPPFGSVDAAWGPALREPTEARLLASANLAWNLQPDLVRTNFSVRYEILYQAVKTLAVKLPAGVRVNSVEGNFIDWKEKNGLVEVELKPQTKGSVNLSVNYEQDLKAGQDEIELVSPEVPGVERTAGFATLSSPANLEVKLAGQEGLVLVDPREAGAAGTAVMSFRYNRLPGRARLQLLRHEEVAVLEATADSANAISAVTFDGQSVNRVIYNVRNNVKPFLRLKLPQGARLWSAHVGDSPVKPLAGQAGEILLPILRPGARNTEFPVEVIYYLERPAFGRSGDLELNLPLADIPVMQFMYSLYLPEKLKFESFGGSLEKVVSFTPIVLEDSGAAGSEGKEITRRNRLQDRYLAQQRALESNVAFSDGLMSREEMMGVKPSARSGKGDSPAESAAGGAGAISGGLLPLRIYIPTTGQLLRFEKRLVIEQDLTVRAKYKQSGR